MDTQDYRLAPSGEGEQAATWKDKPHRLVYDLCGEVERLQQRIDILEINNDRFRDLSQGEGDYPQLLTHHDKHGDMHILIIDTDDEHRAWMAMFKYIDSLGYYCELSGDEVEAYTKAKSGDWWAAKWLLNLRDGYEYEDVSVTGIHTPMSMERSL